MVNIDVKAFQREGYTFEQIQHIIKSEEEFEKTGISHNFEDIKAELRNFLVSKTSLKEKCIK